MGVIDGFDVAGKVDDLGCGKTDFRNSSVIVIDDDDIADFEFAFEDDVKTSDDVADGGRL